MTAFVLALLALLGQPADEWRAERIAFTAEWWGALPGATLEETAATLAVVVPAKADIYEAFDTMRALRRSAWLCPDEPLAEYVADLGRKPGTHARDGCGDVWARAAAARLRERARAVMWEAMLTSP